MRAEIFNAIGMKTRVYVDEQLFDDPAQDAMATIDRLVPRIRDCEVFVCIIAPQRAGSGIRLQRAVSAVTFFELELFQAALSLGRKPVHIFMLSDADPAEEMQAILRLVQIAFPEHHIKGPMGEAEIKEEMRKLVTMTFPHLLDQIPREPWPDCLCTRTSFA